jgi:nucleotide-binding universal stress UspA family protein
MKLPRRFLVPIDLGPSSDAVLDAALGFAARVQGYVLLLHVFERPLVHALGLGHSRRLDETLGLAREAAGRALTAAANRHRSEGVTVSLALQDGTAWRVIVDTAREHDLDLVVLGAGGHHTRGHRLLGGVAEKVLRSAACPVFVVPEAGLSPGAVPREEDATHGPRGERTDCAPVSG